MRILISIAIIVLQWVVATQVHARWQKDFALESQADASLGVIRVDTVKRGEEVRQKEKLKEKQAEKTTGKTTERTAEKQAVSGNPDDSVYVFQSPYPLVRSKSNDIADRTSVFLRLMISGNGYGLGMGYAYDLSTSWSLATEFAITGARNTSELEMQDPYTLIVYVPNKVNRILLLPVMMTARYTIPKEYVAENIAPYFSVGAGATAVVRAPYDPLGDVFSSLGSATTFGRPAGYVGAGITMENSETSYVTLDARYYVLPFGGEGVESIRGRPMKDFNGLFLSLAIGFR